MAGRIVTPTTVLRGEPLDDVIARLVGWPDSTTVRIAGRYVSLGVLRDMAAILRHVQDSRHASYLAKLPDSTFLP